MSIKAEILRGPFDPGGQPETRSGNKLELGFFAWNIKGGMTASKGVLEDPLRMQNYWQWPIGSELVKLAERVGYEYEVPFARWIGQPGVTDHNGANLDFLSTAAALGPMTKNIGLFSTAHVLFKFHPLHIAKFGATIDHISEGRWGINIVTGVAIPEMRAFGITTPQDHDQAYDVADEFVTILKYLWTSNEPVTFEGKYYQLYDAYVAPLPTRKPRPVIMSAGNSPVGLDFGARQSDWVFLTGKTIQDYKDRVAHVRQLAAKYGRTVRTATMVYVLVDSTDEIARGKMDHLEELVDRDAVLGYMGVLKRAANDEYGLQNTKDEDPWGGIGRENFLRIGFGLTAWQIVGSPKTVAEELRKLHEVGVESVLTCFVDPFRGLHAMEDDVIPLLKKMGLRQ
jgi:FMNH2-dependent dimethyl sulfone monooxygenase